MKNKIRSNFTFKWLLPAALACGLLAGCAPAALPAASPSPSASGGTTVPLVQDTTVPTATRIAGRTTPKVESTATAAESTQDARAGKNPQIAEALDRINELQVIAYLQQFTGEAPLSLGGASGEIETRDDEQNQQELTQALYQYLQERGLSVSDQEWYDDEEGVGGRNVIGELPGTTRPEEIVILCAHVDSYCEESLCPGADDDASGAVGVLAAAEVLSGMHFERTLRFVFLTGEEDGLLGSYYYVEGLKDKGENVVAVINLDMLGWDGNGDGTALLYTRPCKGKECAADKAIADAVIQAVEDYSIPDFQPRITQGDYDESDAYSFWEAGYATILAIEDDQDEDNPYYHTGNDRLDTLDTAYLIAYIRAVTAAAAELAGPVK